MALTVRITPGYNWVVGEAVTEAKLNLAANPTIELEGTIGSASLGDNSVLLNNLQVGILTADDAGRSRMEDGYITTAKLADGCVTGIKLDDSARGGVHQYAAGTYSTGVYTVVLTTAPSAYTEGMVVRFKASATNDNSGSGATDINVNSLGAKNLLNAAGAELAVGEIPSGAIVTCVYNGTAFQLVGNSRFTSADFTISAVGSIADTAHGLGRAPRSVRWVLVCQTTSAGYSVGDEVDAPTFDCNQMPAFACGASATNVFLVWRSNSSVLRIPNKSTGVTTDISASLSSWKARCYATL